MHTHRPASPREPSHAHAPLLAVRAPEQLEYLVDESASTPGQPGCRFVIVGADRLVYRLQRQEMGFLVERLDEFDQALHTRHLLLFEFLDHPLLEALHAGQLFTTPALPPRQRAR